VLLARRLHGLEPGRRPRASVVARRCVALTHCPQE
jgi:hypothetical protein